MTRRAKPTARPILPVRDLARAVAFYRSLGFDVAEHDETYALVSEAGVELFHLRVVPGLDVVSNPSSAFVVVGDADRWYARVAAALGTKVAKVTNKPWGMREFSFTDPDGSLIRLGEPLD